MQYEIWQLPIDQLVASRKLFYHMDPAPQGLRQSIQEVGVLRPIQVVSVPEQGILVIDGHRRVHLAHQFNISQLPCEIYPAEQLEELFYQAVHLNELEGGLSLMEKLRALHLAQRYFSPTLTEKLARRFQLSHLPRLESFLNECLALPDWLQSYFHQHNIHLRMLQKVLRFPVAEYQHWMRAAVEVRWKPAELVTVLEQVRDVALRENESPEQLWQRLRMEAILHSQATPGQKNQQLKRALHVARFPILTRMEATLKQEIRTLRQSFPEGLEVQWDKNLERPGIQLQLQIGSPEEVDVWLSRFGEEKVRQQLRKVLQRLTTLPEETL
jgi:hypothetical protein